MAFPVTRKVGTLMLNIHVIRIWSVLHSLCHIFLNECKVDSAVIHYYYLLFLLHNNSLQYVMLHNNVTESYV